ncbi:MAG: selenocysteine-specific translation elongation factor [Polyangiaceae bacterium]|nr:selenocysteine-specific translation elongation factor [Polyangiaceae bacterium]
MTAPAETMRRVVIATAGHVDHGKTSLIRALTGTDTDRLPDEKRRGISIELGFAELPDAGISFIDVPGHKKLVHAMIAGVGGVDGVLVCVAADDGVMPQTREHLHICKLLDIRSAVVAITKADLVDDEMLELAEADVRSTLEALGIEPSAVVRTAVTDGRGLPELRSALGALAAATPPRGASRRAWLPLDRVFSVKGAGTVVTGTLTRGSLTLGAPVYVATARGVRESACRGLEVHGRSVAAAEAPCRVAVNLARLEVGDVARGDVLTLEPELPLTARLDARLTAVAGAERALDDGSPVTVHVGTTRVGARIVRIGADLFQLALDEPIPCQGGVGIVLRGFRATREHGAVLAGGRVLDALAPPLPKRRDAAGRELRAATLGRVAAGDWAVALGGLMEISAPRPIFGPEIERRFGLEPGDIARWLTGKKRKGPADALALPNEAYTLPRAIEALTADLTRLLEHHHATHADEPGMSLETLRTRLVARAGREVSDLVVDRAVKSGLVLVSAGVIALVSFATTQGPEARRTAERVLELIDTAGLEGVPEGAVASRVPGERPESVKSALARLMSEGRARRLTGLWFAERHLDDLRRKVAAHFAEHSVISVPAFKDLAGVSRKQAIPLLEQLDREGTTRRQGDDRVAGKKP